MWNPEGNLKITKGCIHTNTACQRGLNSSLESITITNDSNPSFTTQYEECETVRKSNNKKEVVLWKAAEWDEEIEQNMSHDPVNVKIFSCEHKRKKGQTHHACNYNNIHAVKSQEVIITYHINGVHLLNSQVSFEYKQFLMSNFW